MGVRMKNTGKCGREGTEGVLTYTRNWARWCMEITVTSSVRLRVSTFSVSVRNCTDMDQERIFLK